jgi:hypothetical protein
MGVMVTHTGVMTIHKKVKITTMKIMVIGANVVFRRILIFELLSSM